MEILLDHLTKGFFNMLIISMPIVLTAAGIGLVVGILQAVTQVQEQTIAAAPKILGVFLVLLIMGGFFTKTLSAYLIESVNLATKVITKQDEYILPASDMMPNSKFFDEDKNYNGGKRPNVKTLMNNSGKMPYTGSKNKASSLKTSGASLSQPNFVEGKKIYSR
ncbi:MAG: flagellar biosynthetic protein FliQ [Candidatus Gastranaerophilales bacterium]|nr:flagellar biosynthetic protein FliQ [Candidatus Gastranaerophilales bacterium]